MAPPNPAARPKVASPATRTRTGAGTSTVVTEPMRRCPLRAAPSLITTWCRPCGACPAASRYGVSAGSASQFPPERGGPSPPIAFPSEPSSTTDPEMDGWASATPATGRMVATSDAGMGGRTAVTPLPVAVALRTTTLVPEVAVANSWPKLALRVSPNVSAPDRNATPSATAITTPASRRLRAHKSLILMASITRSPRPGRRAGPGSAGPVGASSWPAIRPSARNSTWSVAAEAAGSWVTITMVWPSSLTAVRR